MKIILVYNPDNKIERDKMDLLEQKLGNYQRYKEVRHG